MFAVLGDDAAPLTAPLLAFDGADVFESPRYGDRWLWHGSTCAGERDTRAFCDVWRSSGGGGAHSGAASHLAAGRPLLHAPRPLACHRHLVVLCVEVCAAYVRTLVASICAPSEYVEIQRGSTRRDRQTNSKFSFRSTGIATLVERSASYAFEIAGSAKPRPSRLPLDCLQRATILICAMAIFALKKKNCASQLV